MGALDESDDSTGMVGCAAVIFAGGCWLIVDHDLERSVLYIPSLPETTNVTFDVAGDSLILGFQQP